MAPECPSSSEAVVLTEFAGSSLDQLPLPPLHGLAEEEKRLRIDAVVLHGIRGGLAVHDLTEGLEVRDLGDERGLWVPERPGGQSEVPPDGEARPTRIESASTSTKSVT